MNKKFSTLVATLLLSGTLFTLNAAPVSDLSTISGIEVVEATATTPKIIKFTKNVTLTGKDYILITEKNVVIDGQGKYKLTGHIVIAAENCTVKGLKIDFTNPFTGTEHNDTDENGTQPRNRGAIVVKANKVTITDNKITAKVGANSQNLKADGIILLPSEKKVEYTITDNQITATSIAGADQPANAEGAVGIALWENLNLDGTEVTPAVALDAAPSFDLSQIKECAVDYQYVRYEGYNGSADDKGMPILEAVVTPNKTNAVAFLDIVKRSSEESDITFNGTAEELADALNGQTVPNISIQTSEGVVVAGVAQLQPTIGNDNAGKFDLVKTPSADEYYLLVRYSEWTSGAGSFIVTVDEEGKPGQIDSEDLTEEEASADNNLWKMEQTLDKDGDYTFIFTNKAGQKLTVNGDDFFHSVGNAPYNNGVVFKMDGEDLTTPDNKYYGLYKSSLHTLTAGELVNIEGDGFSITISPKDLVGNPFAGRLAPMMWNSTTKTFAALGEGSSETAYYLKNAEGDYIVAKLFGAEGGNKDQAYYVFTTVSEEDLAKDLAKATKDRTLFGKFQTYYEPASADDDMLEINSIESMEVQVLAQNNTLKYATVGYANISTTDKTEKTLTASLKSAQYDITIAVGNNIVKPEAFLKNAFYTVTKLGEKENTILAATSCDGKYNFVKSVGNELEAQWALTYDAAKAEYTFTNRENKDVRGSLSVNDLREDDNTKDDIYVIDGESYKIATVADAKEDDGYMWLGDVKNQRYAMGYYVKALEEGEYLWFVGDKEGNISFEKSTEASVATEMVAGEKVDTVKVESVINYYDGTAWKTAKPVLKVPVYTFTNVKGDLFGFDDTKYVFGATAAEQLTIREDEGQYNLRLANATAFENGKIYAGASADYLDMTGCVYDDTKNDLFTVVALNRPEYRRLGATVEDGLKDMDLNNVKFNRTNDVNTFLYENSANRNANNGEAVLNFLGETNLANQPEGSSLAIFVDTAYVRNNTTEPLYLLSVRNEFHEAVPGEDCPVCGESDCEHSKAGVREYRTGDYLVGLTDSTHLDQAWYQNNIRLAFVGAKHVGDSLIINSSEFTGDKKLAKNDTLSFVDEKGKQIENAATFSFRLVDPADSKGDFYIETANKQYVRIHNSVPVLVNELSEAATFNIEKTDEAATANEEIATSSVVVAGVNGAVVVKGAEGKNVIVSTILGKVVANEVVSSDNATIAAPAGVVVVSVDGESFKVVVK